MSSRPLDIVRTLVLDRATANALNTLDAAGVPTLLLKGPAVATAFYGKGEYRPYGDVDLLVPGARFGDAVSALARSGWARPQESFRPSERALYGEELLLEVDGVQVPLDLHTRFHSIRRPERAWDVFNRDVRLLTVGGRTVKAPSLPIQGLIAALHATTGQAGARSHIDLARAVQRLSANDWQAAAAAAWELGAEGGLADGLRLVEGGSAVLSALQLDEATDPDTNSMQPSLGWFLVRSQGTLAESAKLFLLKLFPSRASMRLKMQAAGESMPLTRYYLRRWRRLLIVAPGVLRGRRPPPGKAGGSTP